MTYSVANLGAVSDTVSGATLPITGVTTSVGKMLVLAVASDNNGTAGVSSISTTITDPSGNTWDYRGTFLYNPSATAGVGTTLALWTCNVTTPIAGGTITVNSSPNTAARTATLQEVSDSRGFIPYFHSVGAGFSGNGTALTTGTITAVPANSVLFGFWALEHNNTTGATDSDTTNGTWSSRYGATANTGTFGTSQSINSQYKLVTADGDQSYDATLGSGRRWIGNWLIIGLRVPASSAITDADTTASQLYELIPAAAALVDSDDFDITLGSTNPYKAFFLNNTGGIVELECLEISHPSFTKVYYVIRNASDGLTLRYENAVSHFHDYYPMKIESLGDRNDLDQGFRITFGDLGEILPTELDAVSSDNTFAIKPTIKYRTFRSDDLLNVMFGPLTFEVTLFSFTREGSTFEAKAPQLNINTTGELYKLDRFPMLRGLL